MGSPPADGGFPDQIAAPAAVLSLATVYIQELLVTTLVSVTVDKIAQGSAAVMDSLLQNPGDCLENSSFLLPCQVSNSLHGMNPGLEQGLIRIDISDSRHEFLGEEHRLDARFSFSQVEIECVE